MGLPEEMHISLGTSSSQRLDYWKIMFKFTTCHEIEHLKASRHSKHAFGTKPSSTQFGVSISDPKEAVAPLWDVMASSKDI